MPALPGEDLLLHARHSTAVDLVVRGLPTPVWGRELADTFLAQRQLGWSGLRDRSTFNTLKPGRRELV